ncbi:MAG: DUF4190 domain-containing protein [Ruminococcus flavefaciens]|nr:DUF4190 domain-containing protein [Ruminococcus flavefaciens]MCM1229407.1 DUF4190 domain-containing protein [Ruminococcus flavefaciens]
MDDFNNNENVNLYSSPSTGDVQPNFGGQPPQNQGGSKGLSIASMVCGIVSILGFCCCTPIGIICGLAGVILGILSKTKNMGGQGMALAGIITGAIGIVGSIIWIIVGGAFTESLQEELGLYSSVFSMFM